ncbi:MAG: nucleoside monophosphate kinase [Bacteroidota bacterium]
MKILIVTGPPCSGKGTQSEILSKEMNYKHISIGERCRFEKENKTEIGLMISYYEGKGMLVPDSLMKTLFSKIIEENNSENGIILDGFPRTIDQVKDLIELVKFKKHRISNVINIDVPKEEIIDRGIKRDKISNKKYNIDFYNRLDKIDEFEKYTKPALQYMKYIYNVLTINGVGEIKEVAKNIESGIKEAISSKNLF